jgi:hypothetical protein
MRLKWLKSGLNGKCMDDKTKELMKEIVPNKFCLHCKHRKSMFVEKNSKHKRVYCMMQPSNKSVCGYKTIKAHDYACGLYEQKL